MNIVFKLCDLCVVGLCGRPRFVNMAVEVADVQTGEAVAYFCFLSMSAI